MSWKELNPSPPIDIKKSINEAFQGTYCGKKESVGSFGPQVIWLFQGEEGGFGIYGFTNLNRVMEQVPEGTALQITYKGKKLCKTKMGGMKDVHQVLVEKWDEVSEKSDELPPF